MDGCGGAAEREFADPAVIQVGFAWQGSLTALTTLLNARMSERGWTRVTSPPSWSHDQGGGATWTLTTNGNVTEDLVLDQLPLGGEQVTLEARAHGKMVSC